MVKHHLMPSYYFNERFYIVYNINLIMFYDLLIFIFMSYIKPQPMLRLAHRATVVYRTIPTSNHNVMQKRLNWIYVVYRTIPTSNHNLNVVTRPPAKVVYRTIPTSNHNAGGA